ncbi:cobalamin biosynthesis protein CobD [Defluviimonas sp. 20V17]|uniref:Cobalamin biosynthesis protein CobD n=1 Tax=Allgaiera indica TaxID=765699 RepID=A0AAN4ZZK8_9RHOB|nr:adenosylcobinamide-phosphate synthase CbiB [Allgaiera indica]KDB02333.1 cobalamin biosynthesis protein CobD [Defluviimonas sp. 20V17]GHE02134.1 cobalamin biosynthesis protein CobD [Allgaiera indica]SDX05456.1 adenosylcobinamide-phosphate synthase [Allgaiera indica]
MLYALPMLIALVIDAGLGWPDRLYRRLGHPVVWIGALIGQLDRHWNRDRASAARRRAAGIATALLTIAATVTLAAAVQALLPPGWPGVILTGVLAWPLVAARSLDDHVARVARPLATGDLEGARAAVSMIVGRDPAHLDTPATARAAIESLAENASDGVVAPLFWGLLFGLPGIAGYKAVNTLDSMIGHRTPRHEAFGWAAARIDDVANLIPARMTALLFALAGPAPRRAFATARRDARLHRSPNAGWPEAAMAGSLGIRLSGPRVYGDSRAEEPWVNAAGADPDSAGIGRALGLYRRALTGLALMLALLAAI